MVHIFKTNISTLRQLKMAELLLSRENRIERWNVDIEDCDKVLRVETDALNESQIVTLMRREEIYCELFD